MFNDSELLYPRTPSSLPSDPISFINGTLGFFLELIRKLQRGTRNVLESIQKICFSTF